MISSRETEQLSVDQNMSVRCQRCTFGNGATHDASERRAGAPLLISYPDFTLFDAQKVGDLGSRFLRCFSLVHEIFHTFCQPQKLALFEACEERLFTKKNHSLSPD